MKKSIEKVLNNIADLIKLKTILSISIIITLCILTFKGIIEVTGFMAIASAIITYYFTKKEDEKGDD